MIYVFEDLESDKLSRLYLYHIESLIHSSNQIFRYAKGNGNIISTIKQGYNKNEMYICFMDVVPDNKDTIYAFKRTRKKLAKYSNVYIIPTLPAECLFVSSIYHEYLVDYELLCISRDKSKYTPDKAIELCSKYHFKSMEKLYKGVLKHGRLCLRKNDYYTKPCIDISLDDKSKLFIQAYPIYPRLDFDKVDIVNMNIWYNNYLTNYDKWISQFTEYSLI